jgi:methyl-accepting chemotaxis protein
VEGRGRRGVDGGELTRGSGIDDLAAAVGAAAAGNRDAVREMASHMSLTSEHAESQAAASRQAAAGAQETAPSTEEVAATASQPAENAARLSRMVSTFRV